MSQGSRPDRVADQIRSELATMLAREVHDPGIGFVTLTRVQVSPDLQVARVLYTVLGDAKAPASNASSTSFTTNQTRREMTTPHAMTTSSNIAQIHRIIDAVRPRQRFVISSHSRPDGDSIGSQLAMAYALTELGKTVVVVNKDPAPGPILQFPGVSDIVTADQVTESFDAAIIMECSDLARTGVSGLNRS